MADKALLVGINAYPSAPLNGCINDVHDMANFLVSKFKFNPKDVRIIADQRATTRGILDRLEWLVDVRPGDRCFFHYSGHGAQYPTRNYKQEVDGLLEVIVPFDFNWNPKYMISDKQLYSIFSRIPKNVKFNWVADCCHSGDLTRDLSDVVQIPRKYPVPVDIAWRSRVASKENLKPTGRALIGSILDVGFVSGCRSDQTSADTSINGRPCGALTYFFIKNLGLKPKAPLSKVVSLASAELAKNRYSQRPQTEGARRDRPFLG